MKKIIFGRNDVEARASVRTPSYAHVYMRYECLACESKMASIFNLIVGSSVGCPLKCPLFPYLKVMGYPLSFPLSCPLLVYPYNYGSSGQPNLHGKIPMGSPLRCPLSCPLFSYLEVVVCLLSCPLSCPLFPYMEVVGSLICIAKFPWAAHGQPTPLPTCSPWAAPLFFCFRMDNSVEV